MLPPSFESAGEFLADVTALDLAGANVLLVDAPAAEAFVLLAAAAAVTHRIKLGCVLESAASHHDPDFARALAALDRVSGMRTAVLARGEAAAGNDHDVIAGALDADACRVLAARVAPAEVWAAIDMPAGRAAWKEARAAYSAGAAGIIVPWDPRLIDLLRNADSDEDRSDLQISTG